MPFLTSVEAANRMLLIIRASILLWLGALMANLLRIDFALFQYFDASRVFGMLRPAFSFYSDWGSFIFYAFFIVLLAYGIRKKQALFRLIGLGYIYAQVAGTILLVDLIKFGCGRPRPSLLSAADSFCPAPSFAHALHSFPSSHAVNAAVGACFVLLLVRSRAAAFFALGAALLMAFSRVAAGDHYTSDVLAGLALGAAITGITMRFYLLPRWQNIDSVPAAPPVPAH